MKTSSAKAKGRRASSEVKELLLKHYPELQDNDILVTPSGVPGEDLVMSPSARQIYPLSIEVKCVEKLNIHDALNQAQEHSRKNAEKGIVTEPVVFFRRNRTTLKVVCDAEFFIKVLSDAVSKKMFP